MLSEKTNSLVGEFFVRVARAEKKLEVIRQMLCEFEQFEPYSAFQRIDKFHNNVLTAEDLFNFLKENQQNSYSEDQIFNTFIKHYDYDADGILCFAEFLRALLPADQPILRTLVSQRPIYEVGSNEPLDDEIEYTLTKLICEEINGYFEMEAIKEEIVNSSDFSFEAIFEEIDQKNLGYIDFNSLFEFFRKNAFYPYEEEIIAILRRLDKNDDGRLNFEEFIEAINPKGLEATTPQKQVANLMNERPSKMVKQSVKCEKSIEENIEALNQKINSDKKKSPISDEIYNQPLKDSRASKIVQPEQITERKSRIAEPYIQSDLTERKPENQNQKKKSQVITENISKTEQIVPDYSFSNKKSTVNIGTAFTNTPPRYPKPMKQQVQSAVYEKTPPHYNYYPYEPVRRAFSPMKESILRSSKTPPKSQERLNLSQKKLSAREPLDNNQLKQSNSERKSKAIYGNEPKRSSFNPNEEEDQPEFQEKQLISSYYQENPRASKSSFHDPPQPQQEKKSMVYQEKNSQRGSQPHLNNEFENRISQEKPYQRVSQVQNYPEKTGDMRGSVKKDNYSDPYVEKRPSENIRGSINDNRYQDPYVQEKRPSENVRGSAKNNNYKDHSNQDPYNEEKRPSENIRGSGKNNNYQEQEKRPSENIRGSTKINNYQDPYNQEKRPSENLRGSGISNNYQDPSFPEKRPSENNYQEPAGQQEKRSVLYQDKPIDNSRGSVRNYQDPIPQEKKSVVYQEKPEKRQSQAPNVGLDKRVSKQNANPPMSYQEKPHVFSDENKQSDPNDFKRGSFGNNPANEKKPSVYDIQAKKTSVYQQNQGIPSNNSQDEDGEDLETPPIQEKRFSEKPIEDKKKSKIAEQLYQEQQKRYSEDKRLSKNLNEAEKRFSNKNQEIYQEKPQFYSEDKRFSNKNQENLINKPQIYSEEKRFSKQNEPIEKRMSKNVDLNNEKKASVVSNGQEKRFSSKNQDYYQEKPLISSEEKRLSSKNSEPHYQEKPNIGSEDQYINPSNDDKPMIPHEDKRFSTASSKRDAKTPVFQQDKTANLENEKKGSVFSNKDEKKGSVYSNRNDKKDSVISKEKAISNMENSERSLDQIQEKARLQSLKVDEIIKKDGNLLDNSSEKKGRNSDLGFYNKIETVPIKSYERKSAPLILAYSSFNSDKNQPNDTNMPENQTKAVTRKKDHSVTAELQVKEESEQEEDEENNRNRTENERIQEEAKENEETNQEANQWSHEEITLDLIKYFKTLLSCEEELERCKQDLALRPDFNLVDFFLFFDKEKQGFCLAEEFQEALIELGVSFQRENLALFFRRFMKGDGNTLKFYDFSEAFLPLLSDYAELLNQRKPINIDFQFKYRELFSPETRRLIMQTMKTHMENEECLEAIREALARKTREPELNWEFFFENFDLNKDGFIDENEMKEYMELNDVVLTRKELEMIFERVDTDKDGRISFDEFKSEILPRLEYAIE